MIEPSPVQQPTPQTPNNVGLYSPITIVLMSVLFSCFTGSVIAAINWRRLQQSRPFLLTLGIGLVALLIVSIGNQLFSLFFGAISGYMALLGINLLFGIALAMWQRPTYQVWRVMQSDIRLVRRPSGCATSILIIFGSIVVAVVFIVIVGLPLLSLALSLRPAQTFQNQSVRVTYPGGWITDNMQLVDTALCSQAEQQCLFEAEHVLDGLTLDLIRFSNTGLLPLTIQDADAQSWAAIQKNSSVATVVSVQNLKVDGRNAIERIYNDSLVDRGLVARLLLLIKEDAGSILRLEVVGPPDAFFQDQKEIDSIISGIRFFAAKQ